MKLIRSTLGHKSYLCPRRITSVGGAAGGGSDAEFLKRIQGRTEASLKRQSLQRIVVVKAVDGDIRLVAPRSSNSSRPAVKRCVLCGIASGVHDSGLQTQDRRWVTSFKRQILDLHRVEGMSLTRIDRID